MSSILSLIGREKELLVQDVSDHENELKRIVAASTFLIIGGAGSIGQAVTKEIFKRNPKKLHVVDISENNMVELVKIRTLETQFLSLNRLLIPSRKKGIVEKTPYCKITYEMKSFPNTSWEMMCHSAVCL